MARNIDPAFYELATDCLPKDMPEGWIRQFAEEIQRAYDGTLEQWDEYLEEQRSLRGYTDEERARI